jgi:hypothetical protein
MGSLDLRFSSPSALQNREPIWTVLQNVLPESGTMLEIASGSGEHAIHYAARLPNLIWQPSDPSEKARESIKAWSYEMELTNLLPPLDIDVTSETWPIDRADAMLAINMVHISPWTATEGLIRGAGKLLSSGGSLILYGPYKQEGREFVDSNMEFDAWLRNQNADWGIRQLEEVAELAGRAGLSLSSIVDMPANNLCVIFKRD